MHSDKNTSGPTVEVRSRRRVAGVRSRCEGNPRRYSGATIALDSPFRQMVSAVRRGRRIVIEMNFFDLHQSS
jgi:hypothetical protein